MPPVKVRGADERPDRASNDGGWAREITSRGILTVLAMPSEPDRRTMEDVIGLSVRMPTIFHARMP